MDKQKSIDVLNKLIEINNDRIEGYETASKETNRDDLLNLFSGFIQASKKCKTELIWEVEKLGGIPTGGTKITGIFFRAWMEVKAALTLDDRKAVLDSCEFGEDAAVKTYTDVISNDLDVLTPQQQALVKSQHLIIKTGHDKIKNLRDSTQQSS